MEFMEHLTAISKLEDNVAECSNIESVQSKIVRAPPKTSGLLWVTYKKDLEWFEFSARSYSKFASGWNFAKCIVPKKNPKKKRMLQEIWG